MCLSITHTHTHMHARTHAHTHTHKHTHTHTNIHTICSIETYRDTGFVKKHTHMQTLALDTAAQLGRTQPQLPFHCQTVTAMGGDTIPHVATIQPNVGKCTM